MKNEYYIIQNNGGVNNNPYTSTNILEFTGDTTYSPPSNLLYARIICLGGGGGGGSGRVATATNTMTGGAGGGGGAMVSRLVYIDELTEPTYDIIIGSGGTGASANLSIGSNNGTAGEDGGITSFGSLIIADGGKGGEGGSTSATSGGNGGTPANSTPNTYEFVINGIKGANSSSGSGTNATPNTLGVWYRGCGMINGIATGGGSGGGATTTIVVGNGGAGGRAINTAGSLTANVAGGIVGGAVDGTNGADNVCLQFISQYPMTSPMNTIGIGLSGSGGACSKTAGVPSGNGGHGGLYGAGGGGSGAGLSGGSPNGTGAGGNGSQGLCIIIEYLI